MPILYAFCAVLSSKMKRLNCRKTFKRLSKRNKKWNWKRQKSNRHHLLFKKDLTTNIGTTIHNQDQNQRRKKEMRDRRIIMKKMTRHKSIDFHHEEIVLIGILTQMINMMIIMTDWNSKCQRGVFIYLLVTNFNNVFI